MYHILPLINILLQVFNEPSLNGHKFKAEISKHIFYEFSTIASDLSIMSNETFVHILYSNNSNHSPPN